MLPHVKGIGEALTILQSNKRNMLFFGYLRDVVYAYSNLHLDLGGVGLRENSGLYH